MEGKLGANWEGPYMIAKVRGKWTYYLEYMDGTQITKNWNVVKLRKYYHKCPTQIKWGLIPFPGYVGSPI